MNIQAEAAKAQADAAKMQADASRIQAEAATEALRQAAKWREEEEWRAEPQFRVTVTRISRVGMRDGRIVPPGENLLALVAVVVENTSSRDSTINHVGVEDMLSGSTNIFGAHHFRNQVSSPLNLRAPDRIFGAGQRFLCVPRR